MKIKWSKVKQLKVGGEEPKLACFEDDNSINFHFILASQVCFMAWSCEVLNTLFNHSFFHIFEIQNMYISYEHKEIAIMIMMMMLVWWNRYDESRTSSWRKVMGLYLSERWKVRYKICLHHDKTRCLASQTGKRLPSVRNNIVISHLDSFCVWHLGYEMK